MSFKTLQDGLLRYLGENSTSGNLDQYKFQINLALQHISEEYTWDFLRRQDAFHTVGPHTQGTVDLTEGSRIVQSNGASFGYQHVGGRIRPDDGEDEAHDIVAYDPSTGDLELRTPYSRTSTSAASYTLTKTKYTFPFDVGHVVQAKVRENDQLIVPVHNLIPDLIDPDQETTGRPSIMRSVGHSLRPLTDAGSVAVTNGSATVTLSGGGSTDSFFEEKTLRIVSQDRFYRIKDVTSSLQMTLHEPYRGATGTYNYEIEPTGSAEIEFDFFTPSQDYMVEFRYHTRHPWLIEDNEYPLFPSSMYPVIYALCKWWIIEEEEESSDRVVLARRKYETLLRNAKNRHGVTQGKMVYPTFAKVGRFRRRVGVGAQNLSGQWGYGV